MCHLCIWTNRKWIEKWIKRTKKWTNNRSQHSLKKIWQVFFSDIYSIGVKQRCHAAWKEIGSVPEWLMGADCKSAGYAYVGSNPTRPIFSTSPCSSAVEHSLGKGEVSGSSPDEGMTLNRSQGKQSKALKIAKKLLKSKNINQLEQKLEPKGSFLLYGHIHYHINDFTRFFPYTQVIINKN